MAHSAERRLRRSERAAEDSCRARGLAFARRQERARLDRLTQAVRAFERLPLDPAPVPPAGEEHEARRLTGRLGMSEALLARLVHEAGATFRVHKRGCFATRPRTVAVTPELRDVLLAWCAAPTARADPAALAEAVRDKGS